MGASTIDSVTLNAFNHTWSGDCQIVLQDPNGVGYNLMVRIGVIAPAACCGHSADYGDDYTFLAAGNPGLNATWPATNPGAAMVYPTGNYPQEYGLTWGAGWIDGSDNVFNVDLASIPVVPGIWTLFIYDGANLDTGDLGGWSMSGDGGGFSIGTSYCGPAVTNSTGMEGVMDATGSNSASANNVTLMASQLPTNQFGIFVTSTTQGFAPGAGGTSNGNICLAGTIGRYSAAAQILSTGATGEISLALDLGATPQGSGFVTIMAGETWNFQAWFRDGVGLGSNFTDGYSIDFQ